MPHADDWSHVELLNKKVNSQGFSAPLFCSQMVKMDEPLSLAFPRCRFS